MENLAPSTSLLTQQMDIYDHGNIYISFVLRHVCRNRTNLRKYIATVSQIVSLSDEELEWLCNHLGHDVKVHRSFYRLQESSIELSKLLLAASEGSINKIAGKKITDKAVKERIEQLMQITVQGHLHQSQKIL